MDKLVEQALLYDFYGELLNDHQKRIYEEVVLNDYSLSEVAEEEGISRQGVHDTVRRVSRLLGGYEEKLGLVAKFAETKELVSTIESLLKDYRSTGEPACLDRIEAVTEKLKAL